MSEFQELFITPNEISRELGVSADTARHWIRCGKMKAVNVRGRWLVYRESFVKFRATYTKWARS